MSGFAGNKSDLDVTFIWRAGSGSEATSPHDVLTKFSALLEKAGTYDSIVKVVKVFSSVHIKQEKLIMQGPLRLHKASAADRIPLSSDLVEFYVLC